MRRDKFLKEKNHDPYSEKYKYPENTFCPKCKAFYHEGRWTWKNTSQEIGRKITCPACRRIEDNFPSGFVYLRGDYLKNHLEEIKNIIKNQEEMEKLHHPLQRIISSEEKDKELTVTTTYPQLARRIGEAVHRAHKGDLKIKYAKEEELVRVYWERD
jgi:NMD protein affecting ribosome stability and mRNA decay